MGLRLIFLRRNLFSPNIIWGSLIACISFVIFCSSLNPLWGGLLGKSVNYVLNSISLSPLMVSVLSGGGCAAGIWMTINSRLEDVYEKKIKPTFRKGGLSKNRLHTVKNSAHMHKKSDELPEFLVDKKEQPKEEKKPLFGFAKKKTEEPEERVPVEPIESMPIPESKLRIRAPKKPPKPLIEDVDIPTPKDGII